MAHECRLPTWWIPRRWTCRTCGTTYAIASIRRQTPDGLATHEATPTRTGRKR